MRNPDTWPAQTAIITAMMSRLTSIVVEGSEPQRTWSMDNRIEFAKVILILCIAIAAGAVLSGCATRSYEGTDIGDAVGSGYWGELSAGVGKQLK